MSYESTSRGGKKRSYSKITEKKGFSNTCGQNPPSKRRYLDGEYYQRFACNILLDEAIPLTEKISCLAAHKAVKMPANPEEATANVIKLVVMEFAKNIEYQTENLIKATRQLMALMLLHINFIKKACYIGIILHRLGQIVSTENVYRLTPFFQESDKKLLLELCENFLVDTSFCQPENAAALFQGLGWIFSKGGWKNFSEAEQCLLEKILIRFFELECVGAQENANVCHGFFLIHATNSSWLLSEKTKEILLKLLQKWHNANNKSLPVQLISILYALGKFAKSSGDGNFLNKSVPLWENILQEVLIKNKLSMGQFSQIFYSLGNLATAKPCLKLQEKTKGLLLSRWLEFANNNYRFSDEDIAHLFYGFSHLAHIRQLPVRTEKHENHAIEFYLIQLSELRNCSSAAIATTFDALGTLATISRYPQLSRKANTALQTLLLQLPKKTNLSSGDIAITLHGLGEALNGGIYLQLEAHGLEALRDLFFNLENKKEITSQHIANTLHGLGNIANAEIGFKLDPTVEKSLIAMLGRFLESSGFSLLGITSIFYGVAKLAEGSNQRLSKNLEQKLAVILEKCDLNFSVMNEPSSQSWPNIAYACALLRIQTPELGKAFMRLLQNISIDNYNDKQQELTQLNMAFGYALYLMKRFEKVKIIFLDASFKSKLEKDYRATKKKMQLPQSSREHKVFSKILSEKINGVLFKVDLHNEYVTHGYIVDILLIFKDTNGESRRLAIEVNGPHHQRQKNRFAWRASFLHQLTGCELLDYYLPAVQNSKVYIDEQHMADFIDQQVMPCLVKLQNGIDKEKSKQKVSYSSFWQKTSESMECDNNCIAKEPTGKWQPYSSQRNG